MKFSATACVAVLAVLGLLSCVGVGLASSGGQPDLEYAACAVLWGVFLPFALAIWLHPKRAVRGTDVIVTGDDVWKSAPRWSVALFCACVASWLLLGSSTGQHSIEVTPSALRDRPELVRAVAAGASLFYAASLCIVLSARRLRQQLGLPWLPP